MRQTKGRRRTSIFILLVKKIPNQVDERLNFFPSYLVRLTLQIGEEHRLIDYLSYHKLRGILGIKKILLQFTSFSLHFLRGNKTRNSLAPSTLTTLHNQCTSSSSLRSPLYYTYPPTYSSQAHCVRIGHQLVSKNVLCDSLSYHIISSFSVVRFCPLQSRRSVDFQNCDQIIRPKLEGCPFRERPHVVQQVQQSWHYLNSLVKAILSSSVDNSKL